jgi:hypothetical protein
MLLLLCRAVPRCALLCCCQEGKAAKEDLERWGMECYEYGPDLKSAFELDFAELLQDDALRELCHRGRGKGGKDQANGFHLEDNPWMTVFQEVRVH